MEKRNMTQDERCIVQWKAVMDFMEANIRGPSKFVNEERGLRNWWKYQPKLVNAGLLKTNRVALFQEPLEKGYKYRHMNQYM